MMSRSPASASSVPAPLLVLGGIVSVQFGGALAATLVPTLGAAGAVLLRLGFGTVLMLAVFRPRLRGHSRVAWATVVGFGLVLGAMNWSFYGALGHLPLGVAVTVEFLGPLVLAASLSRRPLDLVAVLAAAAGVLLVSRALSADAGDLSGLGIGLALLAGSCWAGYVVLSGRAGAAFERLDGLALAMVVATALVLPAGASAMPTVTGEDLLKGVGLAVLSSVLPYSLELLALRRLSAQAFGILLSLEPAVAALAGLVVLDQRLAPTQVLGMALVVAASAIVIGLGARERPEPGALEGA